MKQFVEKHQQKITGIISIFDQLIFKGYLPLGYPEAMEKFLYRNGLLIKDFKPFAKKQSEIIKQSAIDYAQRQGRPYQFLNGKMRKDELAHQIADQDGIDEGLVCVFAVVEQNPSFAMRYGDNRPRLVSCRPRCLTLYFYFMDRQFGFIHVRLQAWLPFMIQIYINGPRVSDRPLWLVVIKGIGKKILATEQNRRNRKVLWWVVEAYLKRWRVEDTIRFHQAEL